MNSKNLTLVWAAAVAVASMGCGSPASSTVETFGVRTPAKFVDTPAFTTITGASLDPESFVWSVLTCGDCPFDANVVPKSGHYDRALVLGSTVSLIEASGTPVAGQTTTSSTTDGSYSFTVASRTTPYFREATGGTLAQPANGPGVKVPPVPAPTKYLKTQTLVPLDTQPVSLCAATLTWTFGDMGILQAAAKLWTMKSGTATTVDDLVDPAKFKAVMVVQALYPYYPSPYLPGFDTAITSSKGQLYHMQFAAPGTAGLEAIQSTLGFYLDQKPTSLTGFAVVFFPADGEDPSNVKLETIDKVKSAVDVRPWVGLKYTVTPNAGAITFVPLPFSYQNLVNGDHIDPVLDRYPPVFCPPVFDSK